MTSTLFYLGLHRYYWLSHTPVPVFVSNNTLAQGKPEGPRRLPKRAVGADGKPGPWALDSGGFTVLQNYGTWTPEVEQGKRRPPTPSEYVALVRRYRDEIGGLDWAAPQDWMCEPVVINGGQFGVEKFVGTRTVLDPRKRLTFDQMVLVHQLLTVTNLLELRALAAELWFPPPVQGWTEEQYVRCFYLYLEAGIDLTKEPLVLVGSMCRRQNTAEAGRILQRLHRLGLHRLHGLGFKLEGLEDHGDLLATADSQAWSRGARWGDHEDIRLSECTHQGRRHTNCLAYALWWRKTKVLPALGPHPRIEQLDLFDDMEGTAA